MKSDFRIWTLAAEYVNAWPVENCHERRFRAFDFVLKFYRYRVLKKWRVGGLFRFVFTCCIMFLSIFSFNCLLTHWKRECNLLSCSKNATTVHSKNFSTPVLSNSSCESSWIWARVWKAFEGKYSRNDSDVPFFLPPAFLTILCPNFLEGLGQKY